MAEYIDTELLIQNLGKAINEFENSSVPLYKVASKIGRAIRDTPTADVVEVKHGRWRENKTEYMLYGCSNCDCRVDYEFNYCPHCGAKMDVSKMEITTEGGKAE